jgi:hypothetical protein
MIYLASRASRHLSSVIDVEITSVSKREVPEGRPDDCERCHQWLVAEFCPTNLFHSLSDFTPSPISRRSLRHNHHFTTSNPSCYLLWRPQYPG